MEFSYLLSNAKGMKQTQLRTLQEFYRNRSSKRKKKYNIEIGGGGRHGPMWSCTFSLPHTKFLNFISTKKIKKV